jgi:predicted nucleic acid-binding protein
MRSDDPVHERALQESGPGRPIVTTEFIVLELGNACARAEDHADFLPFVEGLRNSRRVTIIPVSSDLISRGLDLMAERSDKDWSLTDCISFSVMKEHHLTDALTEDRDFEQSGFSALLRR